MNHPLTKLCCLPYAGGGASVYRKWCGRLGTEIEICPVQLAGREEKRREAPCGTMEQQSAQVADEIMRTAAGCRNLVLFGHSMGAKIAYEAAKLLESRGIRLRGVIVSGSPSPDIPEAVDAASLTDREFGGYLQRLGGIPEEILADESLLHLFLPVFRADFAMMRKYCDRSRKKLQCPVFACGGTEDPEAARGEVLSWRQYTSADFGSRFLSGGHFYLFDREEEMLGLLQTAVRGFLSASNEEAGVYNECKAN